MGEDNGDGSFWEDNGDGSKPLIKQMIVSGFAARPVATESIVEKPSLYGTDCPQCTIFTL